MPSSSAAMLVAKLTQRETRHLIQRLRAVGLEKYIELPQIAVMDDATSSGMSSVLSALSRITFPSAGTLTTRCPTRLILTQATTVSGTVTAAIEHLTQQRVDEGQTISDDRIEIQLHGPDFPDLTLTDFPGLVRFVGDNEDRAMINRVDAFVHRHLVQDRTCILAVVPAGVDNTAIFQAADDADPDGTRTISIITKPNLVNPSTS
ncbi:hypothetical protein DYB32_005993 [Aphanomyces invadans]|uniref:Dynamin GTPase domain-containing protein n=1 Tax=Aphanomyces invadans TaxID=157072 RepID=A0A418AWK6_9STRA|nr:hypothetical protein DYB32_005993 [Aphanomyces invadans]